MESEISSKGVFIIEGNTITFHEANYIEDGWYVELISGIITLWEIPYGGGEPIKINVFQDLISAIKAGRDLT